ncbi:MAG: ABC transporter permease, partial [Massilioclostridium sp.]|nr:ABC transporter permease [Massilioclostridium sp.]
MKRRDGLKFLPYGIWMIAFTIIPMALIVYFAFSNKEHQFTLENILRIGEYAGVLGKSLLLAAIATLFCLLIAYPFAYVM